MRDREVLPIYSNEEDKLENPTRRKFLIGLLAGAVGAVAITEEIQRRKKTFFKRMLEKLIGQTEEFSKTSREILENLKGIRNNLSEIEEDDYGNIPRDSLEEIELTEEEESILDQVIRPDIRKKLELNLGTVELLTKYWQAYYQNKGKADLTRATSEMAKYQPELGNQFRENNVPEEFQYIAIPESHWQAESASKYRNKKGETIIIAKGYYQLTRQTAIKYGAISIARKEVTIPKKDKKGRIVGETKKMIEVEEDHRNDPIISARACARNLAHLLERSQGDRRIALSGYNGSFIWDYLKTCRDQLGNYIKKPRYEEFLELLEKRIEEERRSISIQSREYQVAKGDSILKLQKTLGLSDDLFRNFLTLNGLSLRSSLKVGRKLIVPEDPKEKQKRFRKAVSGYLENLKYPPKFEAVLYEINRVSVLRAREEMAKSKDFGQES